MMSKLQTASNCIGGVGLSMHASNLHTTLMHRAMTLVAAGPMIPCGLGRGKSRFPGWHWVPLRTRQVVAATFGVMILLGFGDGSFSGDFPAYF